MDNLLLLCGRAAARDPAHGSEGGQDVHSQSDFVDLKEQSESSAAVYILYLKSVINYSNHIYCYVSFCRFYSTRPLVKHRKCVFSHLLSWPQLHLCINGMGLWMQPQMITE